MGQKITVVDSFNDRPFAGNPAAVCLLEQERDEAWMQAVAREMNLSETAFLRPRDDGWDLRWFTPALEVSLCGHATLACAHVLFETGVTAPAEKARFHTLSGVLTATRAGEWIEMDFPAHPEQPTPQPEGISRALGAAPRYFGEVIGYYLIALDDEEEVRGLRPDMGKLAAHGERGFIVTARAAHASAPYDFVSRFFGPGLGVDEDPVTGSAHCVLGPHWAERLGRTELVGYQCSARGGTVRVRLTGDRVILGGRAVTVHRTELLVP